MNKLLVLADVGGRGRQMLFQDGEQRFSQPRATGHQTGKERIPVVATQRSVVECGDESTCAGHEGGAGGDVPFV